MAYMNRVILAGNLTRDPEVRRTNSGTAVCRLGLATNRRYRSQSGEMADDTTFVDIDVWGQTAEFCGNYLRKGASVLVEGRLRLDQWDDRATGQKRSRLLVVAERVESLGSRSNSNVGESNGSYNAQSTNEYGSRSQATAPPFPGNAEPSVQQPRDIPPPPSMDVDSDSAIDDIPF
ncbi:MAG: single-stranded DNA-binding protein [Lentisphaeria bacterium]|nr:single-stranded DNA-binding protein [Lentisphaeria bacterium]